MFRVLVFAAVAALLLAAPVEAKRVLLPYTSIQKVVRADLVVLGKVTAIEKDTIDVLAVPGAKDKVTYRVAVIKVESGLLGAANVTHVKVGFVPPPPNAPPVRPGRNGFGPTVPTEGMEGVFYLTRHHSGAFSVIDFMLAPSLTGDGNYKDEVALTKRAAAVLTDPSKALAADKPADRYFAAAVLVTKYRTTRGEVEQVKVSAEESRLVLKALTEGDWKPDPNDANALNGYQVFSQLGLTEKDGWKFPALKPNDDVFVKTREAFAAWLAGPGKDYQISKFVPKKK
jgi:hypothetical protein